MINSSYFYQLFGERSGYVYQYTGALNTHEAITQQFCNSATNHSISTIVTEIEGVTVLLSPITVDDADFTLAATAEAPPVPAQEPPPIIQDANAAPEGNQV